MPRFNHHELRLLDPSFSSPLLDVLTDLEHLRRLEMLSHADAGTDAALEDWCTYVLTGIRDELAKLDRLADYGKLTADVLVPALNYARQRQHITPQEQAVLMATVRGKVVKSADLSDAMQGLNGAQRTYQIRRLVQ